MISTEELTPYELAFALPGAYANLASDGEWNYSAHNSFLEDKLLDIVQGKLDRLAISMPPQNGKSSLVSHYFTSWMLGRFPKTRIILASYESDFAKSWGRKSRNTLGRMGKQVFGVDIDDSRAAAGDWGIKGYDESGMVTAGAGGAITGRGADIFIIDDPIKNNEEAQSVKRLDDIWEWYQTVASTRLSPTAAVIVLMTRWSTEDLIGKLQEQEKIGGDVWEYIALPAIAEEDDVLGRKVGEALWPERYSLEWLLRKKANMTSFWWNAMYQQHPTPKGGGLIKLSWFKRYRDKPSLADVKKVVISADTAQKAGEIHDYTVFGIWYVTDNGYYLVHVIRERYTYPSLKKMAKNLNLVWHPNAFLIEDKSSGSSLIQELRENTTIPVVAINPVQDKVMRMDNETDTIEAGNVYLPEKGMEDWVGTYEDEILAFPESARKDQIDMTSQFLKWMREESSGIEIW